MERATTEAELRARLRAWKAAGERVGLVPTMGALHDGHLELVRHAKRLVPRVVVSVFVNPTQFGPREDFARYPRQPEKDATLLAGVGCDLLFLPAIETIYPPGASTTVEVHGPSRGFEGELRPGHFRGVATVVTILFGLVEPDLAVFGEKDAQQLAVVRRLVRDLHLPVEIVAQQTVREADGLAMSSRNAYLAPAERRAALALSRGLRAAELLATAGERRATALVDRLREVVASEPTVVLEYAAVVDPDTFDPVSNLDSGRYVLPVAARVGGTRLLDNLKLQLGARRAAAETP